MTNDETGAVGVPERDAAVQDAAAQDVAVEDAAVEDVAAQDVAVEDAAAPGRRLSLWESDAAKVAPGVRAAAAWTWRLLLILAGIVVLGMIFHRFLTILFPLALAILFAALLLPVVDWAARKRVPRLLAVLVTIVLTIGVVGLVLWFVVDQMIASLPNLLREFAETVEQTRHWLAHSPFKVDSAALAQIGDKLVAWAKDNESALAKEALVTMETITEVATSALLMIFLLIFFLYDGRRIWGYVTYLVPKVNRAHVRASGAAGFRTLEVYVRATVVVAFIDAAVIGTGIAILGVPMALPLTVIIFLGSFIPIVGSVASGTLAVFIALTTQGWISALIVVAILIFVMQMEGHVLQPFLLGRSVKLHPVAVILAIAAGLVVAGIVGGLLAVPIMAFLNTALNYDPGAPPPPPRPTIADRIRIRIRARRAAADRAG